jgi:hypothetical protein
MGVQSEAELGRVVEWLSDFSQIKPACNATKG